MALVYLLLIAAGVVLIPLAIKNAAAERRVKASPKQAATKVVYLGPERFPGVRPPPVPPGRRTHVPDIDEELERILEAEGRIPLHQAMFLRYSDAQGRISERRVTIRAISRSTDPGDIYLFAFCHEREALRTFLSSRVIEAVDIDTGEVIASLPGWLRERYSDSPVGKVSSILAALDSELSVLMYVAKADRRLLPAELAAVISYIRMSVHVSSEIEAQLEKELSTYRVGHDEFHEALAACRIAPEAARSRLATAVQAVAKADGKITPAEKSAVDAVAAVLRQEAVLKAA